MNMNEISVNEMPINYLNFAEHPQIDALIKYAEQAKADFKELITVASKLKTPQFAKALAEYSACRNINSFNPDRNSPMSDFELEQAIKDNNIAINKQMWLKVGQMSRVSVFKGILNSNGHFLSALRCLESGKYEVDFTAENINGIFNNIKQLLNTTFFVESLIKVQKFFHFDLKKNGNLVIKLDKRELFDTYKTEELDDLLKSGLSDLKGIYLLLMLVDGGLKNENLYVYFDDLDFEEHGAEWRSKCMCGMYSYKLKLNKHYADLLAEITNISF